MKDIKSNGKILKYENIILRQYQLINSKPFNNQIKIINEIITDFIDNKKRYVVLNAPTGVGKSFIGVITSMVLDAIENPVSDSKINNSNFNMAKGEFLSHTNILGNQYYKTFSKYYDIKDKNGFVLVKGASNYKCPALNHTNNISDDDYNAFTAEDCLLNVNKRLMTGECQTCEYNTMKKQLEHKKNIVTNYSYYLTDKMFVHKLKTSTITVFDEVHMLNDIFTNMFEIKISEKIINKMIDKINSVSYDYIGYVVTELENYKEIFNKEYQYNQIDNELKEEVDNFFNYCKYISSIYTAIMYDILDKTPDSKKDSLLKSKDYQTLLKVRSHFWQKYLSYSLMKAYVFDDESSNNYVGHIENGEVSFKPIFMKNIFKDFVATSKYNLLMSATVSDVYISETLSIDPSEMSFINAEPVFDINNKQIFYINHASYNYNYLKKSENVKVITDIIIEILNHHSNEKGIIQVTSFYLLNQIVNNIKMSDYSLYKKLYIHTQGEKLESIIDDYKNGKKLYLISPSIWEGIDLPDDNARFNIVVKTPFPSLASPRMKMIADLYKDIYTITTIQKIVQGNGRIIRNKDDYGTSYFLDSNLSRLFENKLNVWRNQFKVNKLK